MNDRTVDTLIQVTGLAIATLLEYLRQPPADDTERQQRDRATMALMEQSRALGQGLRLRVATNAPDRQDIERSEQPPRAVPVNAAGGDRRALAATIWGEARGEPDMGQIAVAWVVKNRAADPGWWGASVREVCVAPDQFSCWWDGQAVRVGAIDADDPSFRRALTLAGQVLSGAIADPTNGADHYHASGIAPDWSRGRTPTARIGHHVFYRLGKNGDAEAPA